MRLFKETSKGRIFALLAALYLIMPPFCIHIVAAEDILVIDQKGSKSQESHYPHPDNWLKQHHEIFLEEGRQICTSCHGDDLGGQDKAPSCKLCHTIYPHSKTWKTLREHGVFANKHGHRICTLCHDNATVMGQSHVTCTECHEESPFKSAPEQR